jgi:hypothetical protein
VTRVGNSWQAVALLSLAAAGHQAWSTNIFTVLTDLFPRKALGSVVGIGGMVGSTCTIIAFYTLGKVIQKENPDSYLGPFVAAGLVLSDRADRRSLAAPAHQTRGSGATRPLSTATKWVGHWPSHCKIFIPSPARKTGRTLGTCSTMAITRHSLQNWQEPLAAGVARHLLTAVRTETGHIDLREHRVVVPSHYAARLIREQLAQQAEDGVLPPQFQTPTEFLNLGYTDEEVASPTDALMAWIEVLLATERTTLPDLLPHGQPGRFDVNEARHLAQVFAALREELGMSDRGRDFAAIAALPGNPEAARWSDLARLETNYRAVLQARGRADRNDARIAAATGTHIPDEFKHIWLAGLAEPQPLFLRALERMAATLPVHIVVGAPASETGFDGWGRPDPAVWRERNTPWTTFDQSVHVVRDPDEALSLLRGLIGDVQPDGGRLAICACDRETEAPRIGATLRSLGGEALDTLGQKHSDHLLHHGLQVWATLLTTRRPRSRRGPRGHAHARIGSGRRRAGRFRTRRRPRISPYQLLPRLNRPGFSPRVTRPSDRADCGATTGRGRRPSPRPRASAA